MTWIRRLSTRVLAANGHSRDPSPATSIHAFKYPELSRLPKAPKVRSIRFKRTNPGSVSHLSFGPTLTPVIDPSHPLARLRINQLMRVVPQYHCSLFEAHAYPHAVLRKFEFPEQMINLKDKGLSNELADVVAEQSPSQSPRSRNFTRHDSVGDRRRAAHTVPMSLMIVTSKKPLHKSAAIRMKMKMRLKEALSLVAIRGAASTTHGPEKGIVFGALEGPHRGENAETNVILEGWTYVIRPSLEVYRCPWPSLLEHLREGLLTIQSHAKGLEEKWGRGTRQRELPKDALSRKSSRSSQRSNSKSNVT